MRTQQEIIDRITALKKDGDVLGFRTNDLLLHLEYKHAKDYFDEGVCPEPDWTQGDQAKLRERMISYMGFAWDKANNCRGISASRSLAHYEAWLWLAGEEALASTLMDYEYYGKPQLRAICEYLGIDADQWDDGVRTNNG